MRHVSVGHTAFSRRRFLGAATATGLGAAALSACGGSDSGNSSGKTTLEWWHMSTTEPAKTLWAQRAKEFEAAHPNVKIKIVTLENEAFKAKLTTVTQSGKPPDLFQSWGGGVLQQQVDAGLVKDITGDVSPWSATSLPASLAAYQFDGKTYGVPFDIGMVGFWYNKELFAKAGITAPPATWAELLDDVKKLKAPGSPRSRWPARRSGPATSTGPTSPCASAGSTRCKQAGADHDFTSARLRHRRASTSRSWSTSSRSRRASSAPTTARPTARPRPWATARRRWS